MRFDFLTVPKIIFGNGSILELRKLLKSYGSCALVVTGHNPDRAAPVLEALNAQGVSYQSFATSGEPSIEVVREGVRQAINASCDLVIGFGGGSALDTAKAIAALLTNYGDPLDYLEVIGKGKPIGYPSAPYIAIPTTSGTGSEATSNAVLYSPEHRVKVSLRSPLMLARVALIDPELTHSSPPNVTAQSGLDALTQVIEPFVSNKANPITDVLCQDGIRRAGWALRRAYGDPNDSESRENMALVSLYGGISLSNAKLGAVHGIAGPFGGMFDAPHGGICARLLPFVMEVNIRALRERQPQSDVLQRYATVASLLSGRDNAKPDDAVQIVRQLIDELNIPGLSTYGITEKDYPLLIEKSAVASSMQGNSIKLTPEELLYILQAAA